MFPVHHVRLGCVYHPHLQYQARQKRQKAMRAKDPRKKARCLVEAEEGLRRCLDLYPADARPYVVLGRILVEQRRYQEARQLYEEGTRLTGAPLKLDMPSQCAAEWRCRVHSGAYGTPLPLS